MWFPNRGQWLVIWGAAIAICVVRFDLVALLRSLGGFSPGGKWLGLDGGADDATNAAWCVAIVAVLMVWRLTRPLALPWLLLAGIAAILLFLWAALALQNYRASLAPATLPADFFDKR